MATRHDIAPAAQQRIFTYSLFDIMRRLGAEARCLKWQLTYVERLQAEYAFPKPFPARHRGALTEAAVPSSRWDAAAVNHWFGDRLPPEAEATLDREAMRAGETVMDARAQVIGLRIHEGGRA